MNKIEQIFPTRGEAQIRYGDNTFKIIREGDFVRCALTGEPIPLSQLRYWNVRLQEPYKSLDISVRRYLALRGSVQPLAD